MSVVKFLYNAVLRLSWEKPMQEEYLKTLGTYPCLDELALKFDDAYKAFNGNNEKAEPTHTAVQLFQHLNKLDIILNDISGAENGIFWEASALLNPQWMEIRELAHLIIEEWPYDILKEKK